MNRKEFIQKLEYLLRNIPLEERREALRYYEDYFADAGPDEEQNIIRELKSPEHVAQTIIDDLHGNSAQGEFTESGYEEAKYRDYQSMATQPEYQKASTGNNNSNKILWIIILVLTLPFTTAVILPIAGTVFGVSVAIVCVSAALLISGIALIGAGIVLLFSLQIAKGLILCGVGCIILSIGIPCLLLTIWLLGKGIPALCKIISKGIKGLFRNGGIAV